MFGRVVIGVLTNTAAFVRARIVRPTVGEMCHSADAERATIVSARQESMSALNIKRGQFWN